MGLRSFLHRLTAPSPSGQNPKGPCKMVCVVNQGLKMGKGKMAAQVGHGAVMATMKAGSIKPLYLLLLILLLLYLLLFQLHLQQHLI